MSKKANISKRELKNLRKAKKSIRTGPESYGDNAKLPLEVTPEVTPEVDDFMHVDDFIDNRFLSDYKDVNVTYARWMFNHFRLAAADRMDFNQFMDDHKLFCMHEGVKHRVTGASRMGDVWLSLDFDQEVGYQKRVIITTCSDWSAN